MTTAPRGVWLFGLAMFGERLEHLAYERGDVFGVPTGRDLPILHHFFIDPIAACVADIGPQRRP